MHDMVAGEACTTDGNSKTHRRSITIVGTAVAVTLRLIILRIISVVILARRRWIVRILLHWRRFDAFLLSPKTVVGVASSVV